MVEAVRRAAQEIRAGRSPLRDAGMIGLVATDEQLAALQRIQALMSLLEGHGDVTMDRAGAEAVPGAAHFSEVLRERREQAEGPARLLQQILGLEAKFRQYAEGEKFVRSVEEAGGRPLFDRVWQGPEWLPSLAEIRDPAQLGPPGLARRPGGMTVAAARGRAPGARRRSPRSSQRCSFPPAGEPLDLRGVGRARLAGAAGRWRWRPAAGSPRCTSTTGCAPGRPPRPTWSPAAAARFRGRLPGRAGLGRRRAEPRGPGPGGPLRPSSPPTRPPATRWTTRPRPCCATSCGAPASTGWRAMAPGPRHPMLGLRRAETEGLCRVARARAGASTRPTRTRATCATGSATSCCRCAPAIARRDPVPILARQADLFRDEAAFLDALGRRGGARPGGRPGAARRAGRAGPPGRARGG